jgi:hypothetical protein
VRGKGYFDRLAAHPQVDVRFLRLTLALLPDRFHRHAFQIRAEVPLRRRLFYHARQYTQSHVQDPPLQPAFQPVLLTTTPSLNRILKVPRDKGQHDGYSKRASLALEF